MFRKIVSNLNFSPALVGQLSFYAKRLKKEEATRRLGLIFTALALVVQSFAIFAPPEAANAATPGQVGSAPRCKVKSVGPRGSAFKVTGGKAIVSFDVTGKKNCKVRVSANSYFAPSMNGRPYKKQILHDRSTRILDTPGRYTMQTALPAKSNKARGCFYQVDLTYGTHNVLPVLAYGHGKLNCSTAVVPPPKPPKPPKPPTPPPVVKPTPVAICSSVTAVITDRTQAYFTGNAQVSGGATVKSYTFVVKNKLGVEVSRTTVASTGMTARTSAVDLTTPGDYSVQLVVQTSLGDKTNTGSCVKKFTIAPPEVCQYNPSLPPNSPDCQPCPDNPEIWIKDETCISIIINTKTATNMTRGNVEASSVTAQAGDRLTYTITVENKGLVSETVTMEEELADVLEYAKLVDMGGGTFSKSDQILTWPSIKLGAGKKETRTIAVQLLSPLPATNTGVSNKESYDCVMTNTFGNTVDVKVKCADHKVIVEQVVEELPRTGPRENMIFAGVLLSVVVYFYARSRQLGKEVRLVRRNLNSGTI